MQIIDAHTHVAPRYAEMAAEVMENCGISTSVMLGWDETFGDTLKRHLDIFSRFPGRFIVFGNIDWSRINKRGFGEWAVRQIEEGAKSGMRGIKIFKNLGLGLRKKSGELWKINDAQFAPIWETAGSCGLPVLIHSADPAVFWQPIDENNFFNGVLRGPYLEWSYYQKDLPSHAQLLENRNEVIARFHSTSFVCPHVGSRSDDLEGAARDLDSFPNLYYDISARMPTLGRSAEASAKSRQFFINYQDRILFGSDVIYDDESVAEGVQAQCLYQPGEFSLGAEDPERKYVRTTTEFLRSNIDFLKTDTVQKNPPFRRTLAGFQLHGLGLPEEIVSKIFYENASRILNII